jgi:hypothetical protein
MKTMLLAGVFSSLLSVQILGQAGNQQTPATNPKVAPVTDNIVIQSGTNTSRQLPAPKPAQVKTLKREVSFGGFFGDLSQARKQPLKDGPLRRRSLPPDNLSYYPSSERPQGFVLFAIRF